MKSTKFHYDFHTEVSASVAQQSTIRPSVGRLVGVALRLARTHICAAGLHWTPARYSFGMEGAC